MKDLPKKRTRSIAARSETTPARKSRKKTHDAETARDTEQIVQTFYTVYDLIEARASEPETKDQPSVLYPSHGTQYVAYSAVDIRQLSTKSAAYYSSIVPERTSSDYTPLVVALLAPSSFDYLITALSLSKLGHTVLLLSTRLSEDGHAHLIRECGITHVFVDNSYWTRAMKVAEHFSVLSIHRIASREDIALSDGSPSTHKELDPVQESKNIAWIIHSSGSTGLPKPNYYSHAAALRNFQSQFDLVGFVTLPLFHMQGLGTVFRSIMNRRPIYMWNANLPLTSQHLVTVLREHPDIQILFGVPYVMKLLADSEDAIQVCRRLDVLLCGGGACAKPVGDLLTSRGVYLVSHIGSSETGQLMNSYRSREEIGEWDWLRPSEELQRYLLWEPYDLQNNIFEMVVLEGWPSKVASNREDGAYATKDLWERHPDYPNKNAWRYCARKDDTIVLNNGEKANPIHFEDFARESPLVADAIVFGAEKSNLGIFLLPSEASSGHEQVVEVVWPLIQKANVVAPAHAQISKEMIQVLDPRHASQIKRTDKSTIIRSAFYQDFAASIDATYEESKHSASLVLDRKGLVDFLTLGIKGLLQSEHQNSLTDDVDLFSLGFDSLQASRLRSIILKNVDVGGNNLAENFVFENPSINAMASELLRARLNEMHEPTISAEEKMESFVKKYSNNFPRHQPSHGALGQHVLVTGATGSLGAHIVAELARKTGVRGIICLVRAKSHGEAHEKLRRSLRMRELEVDDNVHLQAFAAGFADSRFGLSDAEYAELTQKVTCVIHSAWNVNFNLGLDSFESDCIASTRNLIDLCLHTRGKRPATFMFCSSVSAVAAEPSAEIEEKPCASLSFAQNMGYAQSKLVAENICLRASQESGLDCRILRIGQIVGDTAYGIWNQSEAVPMILQSAKTIRTLPELDEDCSWLPVDIVAKAIIECKDGGRQTPSKAVLFKVYNVVNETRIHWTRDLLPMLRRAGLSFEAVSPQEWLMRLRRYPDHSQNPPYKLIDFFTEKYGDGVGRKTAKYRSEKAREASEALRSYSRLDQDLLEKFLRHILGK